jgi:D-glycero-D-manno-heptose 1,7-bisphosphate phosphatase
MPPPSPLPTPSRGPFVFLDRDGTIIENRHYLADPDGVKLLEGVATGLRALQNAGRRLVIVSNQSGVGRGYFTREAMAAVNTRLLDLLRSEGIRIEAIYCCPHSPDEACSCRKPAPGLVHQALRELGGTLQEAVVIGDNLCDIELAHSLGITAVFVRTGHESVEVARLASPPQLVAADLTEAARLMLGT